MSLFTNGFGSFLQTGDLHDVVLKIGGKKYYTHKMLLSFSSGFFDRLFSTKQNWKELEGEVTVVKLKFPDPANVFPLVRSSHFFTHN